jgi:hypothetical protein
MVKGSTRSQRPLNPAERPLDDGMRYGPEMWREIDGVAFCHWDRWLLKLALTELDGLDGIARHFRQRLRSQRGRNDQSEAMLTQIEDLRIRLGLASRTPETVLDEEERASDWLRKKAEKRIWHGYINYYTDAMCNTPRRRLLARALRGHWARFPVSPASFEPELRRVVGESGYYDYRAAGPLARLLELHIDLLEGTAASELERMAVHRAAMTVIIETMDRVDDSLADMSELFAASERAYLELARGAARRDGLLRDLLELAIWEDYGLLRGVDAFLQELEEEHANIALRELAAIITELRRERLDDQLARAITLRQAVLAPWA